MNGAPADVIVVGGGPGGSTAATLLAKGGFEVVQLERQHHPRHQIGESLLPPTIHGVCRLLDVFDDVHAAGFVRKRGGTFRWGRSPDPFSFVFQTYAFQVERSRFDQLLFENARRHGVDAREGVEAVKLLLDPDDRPAGVVTRDDSGRELTLRSRYVIDASGHGSRLARSVGKRVHSEHFRNAAVYGYFRGATRRPPPNEGNVIAEAFENGWCWFIPLSDELTSVGAVVDHRLAKLWHSDRDAVLRSFIAHCPIISGHLDSAERVREGIYSNTRIRRDWSYTTDTFARPGMVLVGDAACFIDPLFSSGVHLSTYSALLAARSVATTLAGEIDEVTCLREFEQRYRREFRLWYEFVSTFADMDQPWESYFWKAKSLLQTEERANEAFVRLVADGRTTPADFFGARVNSGHALAAFVGKALDEHTGNVDLPPGMGLDVHPDDAPPSPKVDDLPPLVRMLQEHQRVSQDLIAGAEYEKPLDKEGLVPTSDGLRWRPPVAG